MPASGPPVIVAQPASQTVGLGDTVTFAAGVGGATPRSYQWFYGECYAIEGATNLSLAVTNVQLTDAGNYHIVVSNALDTATSSNAVLSVTTNGPVTSVLLFSDQGTGSPYRTALNNLGQAHQLFTDFDAFNTAVEGANPATTLAIVDAPLINAPFNAIGRLANKGGRAIFQCWTLAVGNAVAAAFQANVAQALLPSPVPVYNWGGSSFFAGLTSPLAFTDRFGFSGQKNGRHHRESAADNPRPRHPLAADHARAISQTRPARPVSKPRAYPPVVAFRARCPDGGRGHPGVPGGC